MKIMLVMKIKKDCMTMETALLSERKKKALRLLHNSEGGLDLILSYLYAN